MKYVVVLADGMADYPIESLGGKTPLEAAHTPAFDYIAQNGVMGLVHTIPAGMTPGSDTANMSVLGYDPSVFYRGRSPFEAASIGIAMAEGDVSFRMNLVTLREDKNNSAYSELYMDDHSSDEISTAEAELLVEELKPLVAKYPDIELHSGVSYRHIFLWKNNASKLEDYSLTPPHDIIGKKITEYLPKGANADVIGEFMQASKAVLDNSEVNKKRIANGKRPANSAWIWGEGRKPSIPAYYEKYGVSGAVISAVDLIKGLGICAGLDSIDVEGVTGNYKTNYKGKADAALKALREGKDFVFVHIEAPDECGHRNELDNKITAIEKIDSEITAYIIDELSKLNEDFSIMVLPDHPTPIALRTHTSDAVPFTIFRSNSSIEGKHYTYCESNAAKTGIVVENGHELMKNFLNG